MSLAWSRIIPDGEGVINQAGIDHYNQVFDELKRQTVIPFVTYFIGIHHNYLKINMVDG